MTDPDIAPEPPAPPLKESEPVAIGVGGIAALIDALLILCASIGWLDLSAAQTAALVAFVTALSATVGTWMRGTVWSPASVAHLTTPES